MADAQWTHLNATVLAMAECAAEITDHGLAAGTPASVSTLAEREGLVR
jgi:hypothetical protein